jgi:multidrug efflux pump subunit AcrA (membrane-fusion protein)
LAVVTLTAASLAACGSGEAAGKAPSEPAILATFGVAKRAPFVERYEAVGTVASKATSPLASKIMGQVTAVRVHEGDHVRAGQVLVEIEARDVAANAVRAKAGVAEAEQSLVEIDRAVEVAEQARDAAAANHDLAKLTCERYAKLVEARAVSRQEFDEAEARYKMASAELRRASTNVEMQRARRSQTLARIEQARAASQSANVTLGYATIVAPADGIVVAKAAEVGMMAQPGVPLLTIENPSTYRLEASVEESYTARVRLGAEVPVKIDALGGLGITGSVAEIMPAADPASRSVVVKIDLPATRGLRSGQYGIAAFSAGERVVIAVPRGALAKRGQLTSIFVVDDSNVARLRFVTTGERWGDSVEILSGLDEGQRFVAENAGNLADGRKVAG